MASTLTRRDLLSKTTLLLLIPIVPAAAACSSSSDSNTPSTPNNTTPANGCKGAFSQSTVTNNHTHTVCVTEVDLIAPPDEGATYTSSTDAGHNHTVTLTSAQLTTIQSGGLVTVTSSAPFAHDFTIVKKA